MVKVIVGVAVVALAIVLLRVAASLLADYWWFRALGHGSVFTTILFARLWLWLLGFVAASGAVASGILIARRCLRTLPEQYYRIGEYSVSAGALRRYVMGGLWAAAALAGLAGGSATVGLWRPVLMFFHRVPFGVADPIYGNDVGFYVFTVPILQWLRQGLLGMLLLSLASSLTLYVVAGALSGRQWFSLSPTAVRHVNTAMGLIFFLMAFGYLLGRYDLLYSAGPPHYGAGYTDVHARLPALWVMTGVSVLIAGLFLFSRRRLRVKPLVIALAAWLGCVVVFQGVYPSFLQQFRVEPNELQLETPYIEHSIKATLHAYKLHEVGEVSYPVREDLSYADIMAQEETIRNIRLWDWRPLQDTYREIQELRPYYDFGSVDIDRYDIDGAYTQTMLSLREVSHQKLDPQARTWVNLRLQYTHGYGLCMSPVNRHTEEGLPVLLVKDIPPSAPDFVSEDQQWRIYYGRQTTDYVFGNTKAREIDFPRGDENAYNHYSGRGGVPFSGLLSKLVYYLEFGDLKILLSDDLAEGSRLMFHRRIDERVRRLAPYLRLDGDPYTVLHDGRILWIQDAYTTTRLYPYSQPVDRGGYNYIRNGVKAVIDAYDGTVTMYVADEDDPLIRAYSAIFPELYRPMSEMPASLWAHVRYPLDMFTVQADKYRTFHMEDPQVFYNREDMWEVPRESYRGQERLVEPYYIIMELPDSDGAEFILMLPFTPRDKDNMISWLAGRSDGARYGEVVVYKFPKQKLIYGPRQVEARIDGDPDISQQLTLWSQRGSNVIRGNLLVIPVAEGILYVEPLYIQAEAVALPQLKRVIAAYGERVAMRPTLAESLRAVFADAPIVTPADEAAQEPAPAAPRGLPRQATALLERATNAYRSAQEALRAGQWAEYGRRMDELQEALEALQGALEGAAGGEGRSP